MPLKIWLILLLMVPMSLQADDLDAPAKPKEVKGTLPELKVDAKNSEEQNEKNALETEILISKAENQAINTLQTILKRRKGTREEPQLWYRLAELYMRRAKSGRFFDLNRDSDGPVRFVPPDISGETASAAAEWRRW